MRVPQGVHLKSCRTLGGQGVDEAPEAQQQKNLTSCALVNYRKVDAIFGACPLEGTTERERERFIYINEARRANYPTVLIGLPLTRAS